MHRKGLFESFPFVEALEDDLECDASRELIRAGLSILHLADRYESDDCIAIHLHHLTEMMSLFLEECFLKYIKTCIEADYHILIIDSNGQQWLEWGSLEGRLSRLQIGATVLLSGYNTTRLNFQKYVDLTPKTSLVQH